MPWPELCDPAAPALREPRELRLPTGCAIDPAYLYGVATTTNLAHRALGTELLEVDERAVVLRLAWRDDHADADGGWAAGVAHELLDHACSLAAVVALGDANRFGGTMSLRTEHHLPLHRTPWLIVQAVAELATDAAIRVDGRLVAPLADGSTATVTRGRVTVAVAGSIR